MHHFSLLSFSEVLVKALIYAFYHLSVQELLLKGKYVLINQGNRFNTPKGTHTFALNFSARKFNFQLTKRQDEVVFEIHHV